MTADQLEPNEMMSWRAFFNDLVRDAENVLAGERSGFARVTAPQRAESWYVRSVQFCEFGENRARRLVANVRFSVQEILRFACSVENISPIGAEAL